MKAIFVDPAIIATPQEDDNKAIVEEWLNNLQAWLKEALSSHHKWLHFVKATNLLEENGHLPSFSMLRSWQRKYKLDINPALIARDVNVFFRDETLDLETHLEQIGYMVEAENGSITIQPEHFTSRWPDYIHIEMCIILTTACACKYTKHTFAQNLNIATLKLLDHTREIKVSAIITDALPDFERDDNNRIVQTFPLLFTPDDLLPLINVLFLWGQGETSITYAIEQCFKKDWQHTILQSLPFRLGPHFVESVNNAGLDSNEVILTKIVRIAAAVIADKAMSINCNLRQLRKDKTADSPQRTRKSDGAKAWRLTLVDKGVGWRMHYWRVPTPSGVTGSIIEFANVLKKHNPEKIY